MDRTPFNGTNYYRLKMVDFDGRFDYSKIITISNKRATANMMIYPNPANNQVTIAFSSKTPNQNAQVYIFDAAGKIVMSKKSDMDRSIQLDITQLPKGIYTAKVNTLSDVFISRFSKL